MARNDFVPFATGPNANVVSQGTWLQTLSLANGFVAGLAKSAEANKALRQGTFVAASISEWINQQLLYTDIDDDGNVQEWVNEFDAALAKRIGTQTGRVRLQGTQVIWVDNYAGNDNNNGLTQAASVATIQRAINIVLSSLDIGPYQVIIYINANGGHTYYESLSVGSNPLGMLGQGQWQFQTFNGQCHIHGTAATLATAGGAQIVLNGNFLLTCQSTNYGPNGCLVPIAGSRIGYSGNGLVFGNCPGCTHIYAALGGEFNNGSASGAYTIAGGADQHALASQGGAVTVQGSPYAGGQTYPLPITIQNSPNFTNFAVAVGNGTITMAGLQFPGTGATGGKYYVSTNGVINTGGGGAGYLPGTIAGAVSTGGQYV